MPPLFQSNQYAEGRVADCNCDGENCKDSAREDTSRASWYWGAAEDTRKEEGSPCRAPLYASEEACGCFKASFTTYSSQLLGGGAAWAED